MDSIRSPFFASAVATVDRVLSAQVNSIFSTQILNNLKPEDIGAVSVITRQYATNVTLANNTDDQIITSFAFPGGCLGNTGFLEFNIWMTNSANTNTKRIRAWLNNSSTPPATGTITNRIVSYAQSGATSVSTMRGGFVFVTGSPTTFIAQPSASGGTGQVASSDIFETTSSGLDFSNNFYLHIGLQKAVAGDVVQFRYARCVATYGV
jgi:hypothetical protein